MKRVLWVAAGMTLAVTSLTAGTGAEPVAPAAVSWGACSGARSGARVECASVQVPLDYGHPDGRRVTLALNRVKGAESHGRHGLGVLLVNPGGPGASGTDLARYVAAALPKELLARYDVIGFDPRGVGASRPALTCVDAKEHYAAPRRDEVPADQAAEQALLARARHYAQECGRRWPWLLPHLTTENSARDMDAIRQALGEQKISYLGYSYGTYLGSVYATLFPGRVRRLVLDSVVDPEGVWYQANIAQDYAFDRRHRDFLAWVARNDDVYRLGDTAKAVTDAWYGMRRRLAAHPAGGIVGPSELDDIYTVGGYTDAVWPQFAAAFSTYVRRGGTDGLLGAYRQHVDNDAAAENNYAVYLAVQCRDAQWPREWSRWNADTVRIHRKAPFMAWANAWYNAPCAFWPEKGGTPVRVGGTAQLPPIMLIQSRRDAATPLPGALRLRERFPGARLLMEGGGNHGVSLGGNECVDRYLATYLRDGRLPGGADRRAATAGAGRHADATCPAGPEPRPVLPMSSSAGSSGRMAALLGH
ncbi:peptidase [Sphaerisporangium rufum]|uniref:Peptidase n=1 Tax=Sphaerisporangium rufum TaxID=1381558 RepID=A0A919V142_9ACTN|nr:alpha/beta hydrolase [Sphaerisporangium rufum]GII78192.1 peptidase [Sphaerisporangium rufum]